MKKIKNVLLVLVLMIIVLSVSVMLYACDTKTPSEENCEHNYEFDSFVWDGFTAKAKYVCTLNDEHTVLYNAEVTSEVTTEPKCGVDGEKTYTATYDGHTDTKTEKLNALEHKYEFDSFVWEGYTAKAKYVCTLNGEHTALYDAEVTSEVTTEPKCGVEGEKTYTATYDGHTDTKTEKLNALEHKYEFDSFVWEGYTAKAKYVCTLNDDHTALYDAEVTSEVTREPQCGEIGEKTYTATYDGHTDMKTEILHALEHKYEFDSFVWEGYTAKAKYVCTLNGEHIALYEATITSEVTREPQCGEIGEKTYTATYDGHTDTKTEKLNALEHSYEFDSFVWDGFTAKAKYVCTLNGEHIALYEATITSEVTREPQCEVTGVRTYTATYDGRTDTKNEELNALEHEYEILSQTEVDCETDGSITYKCKHCGNEYTNITSLHTGHDISGVTANEKSIGNCQYVLTYECNKCNKEVEGAIIERHNYESSLVSDATCSAEGLKVKTCKDCEHQVEELIPVDAVNGHNWTDKGLDGNIRAYECSYCHQTKTVIDHSADETANLLADTIKEVGEVNVNGVVMKMDDNVTQGLNGNIDLSAGVLEGSDLDSAKEKLTEEERSQLADAPIYNFTMKNGEDNVDFNNGKIKISLPYTLSEGEDVDSISIWYISENKPVSIKAVYSNGFVIFEVEHFSYYTVVRLTPKQRCELYGHQFSSTIFNATCTTEGYTLTVCFRCGLVEKTNIVPASGHDFTTQIVQATCTNNGYQIDICEYCQMTKRTTIPAKGHTWELVETVAPTCNNIGYELYKCTECNATNRNVTPAIGHAWGEWVLSTPATCTEVGYYTRVCEHNPNHVEKKIIPATNHDFGEWVVTKQPTCTENGEKVRVCSHNSEHIETSTIPALGHEFGEWTVTKEATCTERGIETRVCLHNPEHIETRVIEGYGHTEVKVEGRPATCTESGLTDGIVCSMCGEIIVAQEEIAPLGHTEVKVEGKPATCTESGLTDGIVCSMCGEIIVAQEEIAPLGHNYKLVETVDATEEADGYHKYVCENCQNEKIESIPAINHIWILNETKSATCTENGYNKYVCSDCGKERTEVLEATGHDFGEWTVSKEATCTENGEEIRICSHNPEHVETKVIEAFGHREVKIEGKPATCTETGLTDGLVCSVCGQEIKPQEVIPLVPHNYVNGVCTVCGAKEVVGDCKHTNLSEATVELSDFGMCTGVIKCHICNDCSTYVLNENELMSVASICELDSQNAQMEEGIDENGAPFNKITIKCLHCNTIYEMYSKVEFDNHCREYALINIIKDGNVILKAYAKPETDYSNHTVVTETIDLSAYSSCGGTLLVERCTVCGDVLNILKTDSSCEVFGENYENSTYTDENGITHTVMQNTCSKCGLSVRNDMYSINLNDCISEMHVMAELFANNESILKFENVTTEGSHSFESTYILDGETCEDGYTIIRTCKVCGERHEAHGRGHIVYEKNIINFSEYACCSSEIVAHQCAVCQKTFIDFNMIENLDKSVTCTFDGNPNIIEQTETHSIIEMTCSKCGLVYRIETTKLSDMSCVSEYEIILSVLKGESILLDATSTYTDGNHNFNERYEMKGKTCDDGYIVYRECTVCGYTEQYEMVGHRYNPSEELLNLEDYQCCKSDLHIEECSVCGNKRLDSEMILRYYDFVNCELAEGNSINEENYQLQELVCSKCGLIFRFEMYSEGDIPCYSENRICLTILKDEEVIITGQMQIGGMGHRFETRVELLGETCEDGYRIVRTCTLCGYEETENGYGHRFSEKTMVNLEDCGCCGGEIITEHCEICNKNLIREFNLEMVQNILKCPFDEPNIIEQTEEHMLCELTCPTCGLVLRVEMTERNQNSCIKEVFTEIEFVKDGNSIIQGESTIYSGSHDFECKYTLYGKDCNDGVYVERLCKNCGFTESYETFDHSHVIDEYCNLSDYGACGGRIEMHKCACGKENYSFYEIYCSFESTSETYIDENGCEHIVTNSVCRQCGLIETRDVYVEPLGSCESVHHSKITISKDDFQKIFEMDETVFSHDFVVNVQNYQENVQHITATCSVCGITKEANYITEVVLSDVGTYIDSVNGRSFIFTYSPEQRGGQYTLIFNSNVNVELVEIYRDGYESSSICWQNINVISRYMYYGTNYRFTVTALESADNTEEAYTLTLSSIEREENHNCMNWNSVEKYVLINPNGTCEEGLYMVTICEKCGYIENFSITYDHRINDREIINLSTETCEHGSLEISECVCGSSHNVFKNIYNTIYTDNNYEDEQGRIHYVTAQTCKQCGLRVQEDYYIVNDKENCISYTYSHLLVNRDNELIKEYQYVNSDESHQYEVKGYSFDNGENCENGVRYEYACAVCGKSYVEHYNHHKEFVVEKVNLSDYGCVCGGTAIVKGCACGYTMYVDRSEVRCDFQETWDGYDTLYSCAVTEPLCSFKILKHRVLVPIESCSSRIEYHWLFGYNTETQEYAYKVECSTGDIYYSHIYDIVENDYEENGLTVHEHTETCTKCGIWTKRLTYMNSNGENVKYVYETSGGYSETYEYIFAYGYQWNTLIKRLENGVIYQTSYAYDFDSCQVHVVFMNENGNVENEYTESLHTSYYSTWRYQEHSTPTCTQDGFVGYQCAICGATDGGEVSHPYGHNWIQYKDGYVCTCCGLTSETGINGSVYLEDLSEDDGNYIIGYYKSNEVSFINNVSIVLHTPNENGEDVIILPDINIFENANGVRAFEFSRDEVVNSALNLGYEYGTYDVRFTMVPLGADGSFDYSITLTSDDNQEPITGDGELKTYKIGYNNEFEYTYTPSANGDWNAVFFGKSKLDVYITNSNGDMVEIMKDICESYFHISFTLSEGETYIIRVYADGEGYKKVFAFYEETVIESPVENPEA